MPTMPMMPSAITVPRPLASTPLATAVMPPIIKMVLQLMLWNICFWFRQPVRTLAAAPMAAHIYIGRMSALTTIPMMVRARMVAEMAIFPVNWVGTPEARSAWSLSGMTMVLGSSLSPKK